jgi:hypothetical protein
MSVAMDFSLLKQREIHFHQKYREQIDKEADDEGKFAFSEKWPSDPRSERSFVSRMMAIGLPESRGTISCRPRVITRGRART